MAGRTECGRIFHVFGEGNHIKREHMVIGKGDYRDFCMVEVGSVVGDALKCPGQERTTCESKEQSQGKSLTLSQNLTLREKATIQQVTTMLATAKYVLFPGYNHLLTTGTDNLTL